MSPKPRGKPKAQCKLSCCTVSDETKARIKESVEATRGKSMFPDDPATPMALFGAQCRCGVRRKPPGLAKHVTDDGLCMVHPDRPPQPWTRGAERYEQ